MDRDSILEISDLGLVFDTDEGLVRALNGVWLSVKKGQSVGVIGESGCGKSVTAYSILRLLPATARIISGSIKYRQDDEVIDLTELDPSSTKMRKIRGAEIAMIFQEPMTAFSPIH